MLLPAFSVSVQCCCSSLTSFEFSFLFESFPCFSLEGFVCAVLFFKNPCDSPHFQIIFPDLPSSKEKFSNLHSNGFLLGIGFLLSGPLSTELYCVSSTYTRGPPIPVRDQSLEPLFGTWGLIPM